MGGWAVKSGPQMGLELINSSSLTLSFCVAVATAIVAAATTAAAAAAVAAPCESFAKKALARRGRPRWAVARWVGRIT